MKEKPVLWSDESTDELLSGNDGFVSSGRKRSRTIQLSVPTPAPMMGCAHGIMGNLDVWEGSMNAKRYSQALKQHM